ncbi:hypothetical protein AAY473_017988, partial [Plecturocebus cupreus]
MALSQLTETSASRIKRRGFTMLARLVSTFDLMLHLHQPPKVLGLQVRATAPVLLAKVSLCDPGWSAMAQLGLAAACTSPRYPLSSVPQVATDEVSLSCPGRSRTSELKLDPAPAS